MWVLMCTRCYFAETHSYLRHEQSEAWWYRTKTGARSHPQTNTTLDDYNGFINYSSYFQQLTCIKIDEGESYERREYTLNMQKLLSVNRNVQELYISNFRVTFTAATGDLTVYPSLKRLGLHDIEILSSLILW